AADSPKGGLKVWCSYHASLTGAYQPSRLETLWNYLMTALPQLPPLRGRPPELSEDWVLE
ncbi:MAG: hypothetical protein AAF722_20495, partial [Cyanobacteria bacterium P01_C01_bin.70]